MLYVTTCAITLKGDRVGRGVTVELTPEEAARFGGDLMPIGGTPAPAPAPEPEKAIEEMSKNELKAKAKALGLKDTGSIADLVERITLHLAGGDTDPAEA
jgi:hypothetical protein